MLEVRNNTIIIEGRELQFDYEICEALEYDEKLVIVFETDDTETDEYFDNVYCYTKEKQLLWRIKTAPVKMAGTARSRYVGINIINNEFYARDFCGRQFLIDTQNGEPVLMRIVK